VSSLRVFPVYNKDGDSNDVVMQEQGFSIIDTHEPAIAMPLSVSLFHHMMTMMMCTYPDLSVSSPLREVG
jgi:hypothetical protein